MRTLFEKYGGFTTVSKVVMDFYGRVLDSDIIGDYFDGIDMQRLIDHQTKFVAQLMGGPVSYSNDVLQRAHAPHNIDRKAFEETKRILGETLMDHGIAAEDVATIMADIDQRSHYIISVTT
jgi:hemoglobin